MDSADIAKVCHEANRVMTYLLEDVPLQPHFDQYAAKEMIQNSIAGVKWRLENRDAPASAQHAEWMRAKLADGWKLGPTKNTAKKEHPALVPYEQLAPGVQAKDRLFTAIVLALG